MKEIKVFQIKYNENEPQTHFRMFESLATLKRHNMQFDFKYYKEVYSGLINADNVEDIYRLLQFEKPNGYKGHSLSVSDIVLIDGKYMFCDSYGFTDVTKLVSE